jgi:release factor glutamine methyltransferase
VTQRIGSEAREWLRVGGWLVMELGYEQAERIEELLDRLGYSEVAVSRDLAQKDRIVEARWQG